MVCVVTCDVYMPVVEHLLAARGHFVAAVYDTLYLLFAEIIAFFRQDDDVRDEPPSRLFCKQTNSCEIRI